MRCVRNIKRIIVFSRNTTNNCLSTNLATCSGSSSHRQANSQTTLKVHSVDAHIVGSQMFTNRTTIKGTNDCW